MSGKPGAAPRVARPAARYRPGKAPTWTGGPAAQAARTAAPPVQVDSDEYEEDEDEDPSAGKDTALQEVPITDVAAGTQALRQGASRSTAGIVIQQQSQPAEGKLDIKFGKPGRAPPIPSKEEEEDSDEYGEFSWPVSAERIGRRTLSSHFPTMARDRHGRGGCGSRTNQARLPQARDSTGADQR